MVQLPLLLPLSLLWMPHVLLLLLPPPSLLLLGAHATVLLLLPPQLLGCPAPDSRAAT
jgi:hypothetical protein